MEVVSGNDAVPGKDGGEAGSPAFANPEGRAPEMWGEVPGWDAVSGPCGLGPGERPAAEWPLSGTRGPLDRAADRRGEAEEPGRGKAGREGCSRKAQDCLRAAPLGFSL